MLKISVESLRILSTVSRVSLEHQQTLGVKPYMLRPKIGQRPGEQPSARENWHSERDLNNHDQAAERERQERAVVLRSDVSEDEAPERRAREQRQRRWRRNRGASVEQGEERRRQVRGRQVGAFAFEV